MYQFAHARRQHRRCHMVHMQGLSRIQNRQAMDHIRQLTHIAGPVVTLHNLQKPISKFDARAV